MFESYEDILTVEDLMEMLHICKSSAYSLLRTNQIYSVRIGKKYIIPKKSVLFFLDGACYNTCQIVNGRSDLVAKGEKA